MSLADVRMEHAKFLDEQSIPDVVCSPSFESVVAAWLNIKLPKLSNGKHQIQVVETIKTHVLPYIGKKPIDQIKRAELVEIVRKVADQGLVETAHRIAGRVRMVFDYAQDAGILESQPATGLSRVIEQKKRKQPMPSIPPEEAGRLFKIIKTYDEKVSRLGLMLVAHTFVLVNELIGAHWDEINYSDSVWVIPEERMKLRKPHVVPLSKQSMVLLRELQILAGDSRYVVSSPLRQGKPISENTLLFALYRLGYRGLMTVHGFRALASTVLNEQSEFDRDAIERQLSHKESDAVRAAYNRAEYLPVRRVMMQWWSDWIDSQYIYQDQTGASE